MSWPQEDAITQGVVETLRVNMGLKPGELLLVVTDVPRARDWRSATPPQDPPVLCNDTVAR